MKNNKVFHPRNHHSKLPVFNGLTIYLVLEHFHAPQWLYGAFAVVWLILMVAAIYTIHKDEYVDVFDTDTNVNIMANSSFKKRLEEIVKKQTN